jgi:putative flippase GtrA
VTPPRPPGVTPPAPRRAALAGALLDRRQLRFAIVGGVNTCVDLLVFNLLLVLPLGARHPSLAAALAYAAATGNAFLLHRGWTFRFRGRGPGVALRFAAVNAVGLSIHAGVAYLAALVVDGFALNLAKLAAVGLGFLWSYLAYSRWAFATRRRHGDSQAASLARSFPR